MVFDSARFVLREQTGTRAACTAEAEIAPLLYAASRIGAAPPIQDCFCAGGGINSPTTNGPERLPSRRLTSAGWLISGAALTPRAAPRRRARGRTAPRRDARGRLCRRRRDRPAGAPPAAPGDSRARRAAWRRRRRAAAPVRRCPAAPRLRAAGHAL